MDEVKQLLRALIDAQQTTNAKLEAMEMRLVKFEGDTKENFSELQSHLDYIAGKIGEHDMHLSILKRKQG